MFGREVDGDGCLSNRFSRSLGYLEAQRVRARGSVFTELQAALLLS